MTGLSADPVPPSTGTRVVPESLRRRTRGRVLLAASTGGHLAQLHRLAPRLELDEPPLWVTFDSPQSRSLLRSEANVHFVPYIAPRDWRRAASAFPVLRRLVAEHAVEAGLSTGAALAVPALVATRLSGAPATYVESVSRFDGPSLSGRILAALPGIATFTQHATWASGRWPQTVSLLDEHLPVPAQPQGPLRSVFVTMGTVQPYRFDALVAAVLRTVPAGAQVRWQLGASLRDDLPGPTWDVVSDTEFDDLVRSSDVVVSHAGVGSALRILELGKCPVLVPRRSSRGEHVDDHQVQVARELSARGLAVHVEADDLDVAALHAARAVRVR